MNRNLISVILFVVAMLSGCGTETMGLIYADTYPAGDAMVVRTRSLGVQLRLRREDVGLGLGWVERIFVFETGDGSGLPAPGRNWMVVPLPERSPLARVDMTIGVDASVSGTKPGVLLGLRQRAILASIPADASVAMRLSVDVEHPERSEVRVRCREQENCP